MHKDATIVAISICSLWVLMHLGGSTVRSLLYVNPFLVDPEDPTTSKFYTILCKKCGPWLY